MSQRAYFSTFTSGELLCSRMGIPPLMSEL